MIKAHEKRIERIAREHPELPLTYTDARIYPSGCVFKYGVVRVQRLSGGISMRGVVHAECDLQPVVDPRIGRARWFAHFATVGREDWRTQVVEFAEAEWSNVFQQALDWMSDPTWKYGTSPLPGKSLLASRPGVFLGIYDALKWFNFHDPQPQTKDTT